jgi:hypothetical protein
MKTFFYSTVFSLILATNIVYAQNYKSTSDTSYTTINQNHIPEFINIDQLKAASFLNECINTLARIEHSDSQIVLEEELDRLTNVLGWKNATDYDSIVEFRKKLQNDLNALIINSINKNRYIKKYERKQNRVAKDAFLNAISGVQINVNWTSIVSNVLISSARAYMDYNKRKEELGEEMDDELWKLEIEQRNTISVLRQKLMDVYNEAYAKYDLENNMSMTIGEIRHFYDILEETDIRVKVQNLIDKVDILKYFTPYWFERGCAYIDLYEDNIIHGINNMSILDKAWEAFMQYEELYQQCILYRYDYRTGMIALYKLKYLKGITQDQRERLIDIVLQNVGNDGNALLYAALECIESLNNVEKGFNIMRQILINEDTSAHNEVILAAAAYWDRLEDINVKDIFIRSIYSVNDIDLDAYIAFLNKIEQDKSINSYPIKLKLQSSISLIPIKMDKDKAIWSELTLNCNNDTFWFDNTEWDLNVDVMNGNTVTCYEYIQIPEDFDKKYFHSISDAYDNLKSKVKYFRVHTSDIDRVAPFSYIRFKNDKYYYLAKEFNDIKSYCTFRDLPADGEHIKKYDQTQNIESEYNDFCEKYLVKDVKYIYSLTDSEAISNKMQSASAKYTYKIIIPHIDDNSHSRYDIYLCFQTDYITAEDPLLYFSGIIFNNEYIRF